MIIVGRIADVDIHVQRYFKNHGLTSYLIRSSRIDEKKFSFFKLDSSDILYEKDSSALWRSFKNSSNIISVNGGLIGLLFRNPILILSLVNKNIYNLSTGADFSELLISKSIKASIYRLYLRLFVKKSWTIATKEIISNIKLFAFTKNSAFVNIPFWWPENRNTNDKFPVGTLRMLHLSNLDWGETDNHLQRSSIKSNDLFIFALRRLAELDFDFSCNIAFRGPDKFEAYKLIYDLGLEPHVKWIDNFEDYDLLISNIDSHDLIIDQFYNSGLGGIANLALARGKMLMTFVDEDVFTKYKHTLPPVINCNSTDSILHSILNLSEYTSIYNSVAIQEWYHSFNKSGFILSRLFEEGIDLETKR